MAMHVKTYLAPSEIEGLGLFADERITKGSVVWRYDPPLDIEISKADFDLLPVVAKGFVERYGYYDTRVNMFVVCGDDARFMNHSDDPNVAGVYPDDENVEGIDIALRDIEIGEEITCDYATFDGRMEEKMKLNRRKIMPQ